MGLALNDLLGGQIHLVFGGMPPMIPQIRANRLRGIAVTYRQALQCVARNRSRG
jgi:tripartite-type tricarboxylate transporter receptor subunit TctC